MLGLFLGDYGVHANNNVLVSIYSIYYSFKPIRARGHLLALLWSQECPNFIFVGVREDILLREFDGGTAWNRVEAGDCPLTSPIQDIQVSWVFGRATGVVCTYNDNPA